MKYQFPLPVGHGLNIQREVVICIRELLLSWPWKTRQVVCFGTLLFKEPLKLSQLSYPPQLPALPSKTEILLM